MLLWRLAICYWLFLLSVIMRHMTHSPTSGHSQQYRKWFSQFVLYITLWQVWPSISLLFMTIVIVCFCSFFLSFCSFFISLCIYPDHRVVLLGAHALIRVSLSIVFWSLLGFFFRWYTSSLNMLSLVTFLVSSSCRSAYYVYALSIFIVLP